MKRALPVVQKLIAAPCDVPWSSMKGDDRKRHCAECSRDVHNLSAMTKDEVQAFLRAVMAAPENAQLPCVNIYARQDGTILTQDCPVGLRARRRRALLTSTLGLGGVAIAGLTALAILTHKAPTPLKPEPPVVATIEPLTPSPVLARPESGMDTATVPGFVTIEGPPGTEVFEGSTRLGTVVGTVPVTVQAAPGDHTYRAAFRGKDEVFALTVGPNSCAMHRVSLGSTVPVVKPTGTGTGMHPHHVPVAGRMAWPRRDRAASSGGGKHAETEKAVQILREAQSDSQKDTF